MQYDFKWQAELKWALLTFAIYVGGAFLLTENQVPDSWRDWTITVAVSGGRAVVAGIVPRLISAVKGTGTSLLSLLR